MMVRKISGMRLCSMAQLNIVSSPRLKTRIETAKIALRTTVCSGGSSLCAFDSMTLNVQPIAIARSDSRIGSRHDLQPKVALASFRMIEIRVYAWAVADHL